MKLAYTMAPGRGDTDLVLERLANALGARGIRCCGTVQINSESCDAGLCVMDVRVLPDGAVLRISQDLGPQARGCRLVPTNLETEVGLVSVALSTSADLMIINKFGKHEAEERGFRNVIAEALAMDIPVLAGLNTLNQAAFETFAEGMAVQLPSDHTLLMAWLQEVTMRANELV